MGHRDEPGELPPGAVRVGDQGARGKIVARLVWEADAGEVRQIVEEGRQKKPPREPTRDQLAKLEGKPELGAGALRILLVFDDVTTERPPSISGMMPIPRSAVWSYARDHGIDYATTNYLWRVIRIVDGLLIARSRKAST